MEETGIPAVRAAATLLRTDMAESAPTSDAADSAESGSILGYLQTFWRRKRALSVFLSIGFAAGMAVTLIQTPGYRARATVEIQDMDEDFPTIREGAAPPKTYSALADIKTQIEILRSKALIKRTLAKLRPGKEKTGAQASSTEGGATMGFWSDLKGRFSPKLSPEEEAVRSAARRLDIQNVAHTRIVHISFDSPDAQWAAQFVNTLASEYISSNMEARWEMGRFTNDWMQKQLEDLRAKLQQSEDALQQSARKANLVLTSERQNLSEEKLQQFQTELGKAQAQRMEEQARYELASRSDVETLAGMIDDAILRKYQMKLAELRHQEAELSTVYLPQHEKMQRVSEEIRNIHAALQQQREGVLKRIRSQYDEAAQREAAVKKAYSDQARLVSNEAEIGIPYNILKREVDSNRQLYQAMLERVKESSIRSAIASSNVRLVDTADPPSEPYKPTPVINMALGILSALLVGGVWVISRQRADRSLREPGEAKLYFNARELGVVLSANGEPRRWFPHSKRNAEATISIAGTARRPATDRVELVTWDEKPSPTATSFRGVLTSILMPEPGGGPRVMVITSGSPGEGKTTVTCNLGISLAKIRQRILLIDADLRRPRLHEIFGVSNERGLSNVLDEQGGENDVDSVIHETWIPGLYVLPAGPINPLATDLLYSVGLPAIVRRLRLRFDRLLIDTAPVLVVPDARVLGRLSDAVILIARSGVTTRDSAQAVRQQFMDDEIAVLGVVLNAWDPKLSINNGYGYAQRRSD